MSAPSAAVTRIRTWVASATTKSTNHYTITAIEPWLAGMLQFPEFKPVAYVLAAFGSAGPRAHVMRPLDACPRAYVKCFAAPR